MEENNNCNLCINCWCHGRLAENSGSHLNFRNPGSLIPLFLAPQTNSFRIPCHPSPRICHTCSSSFPLSLLEFVNLTPTSSISFHWWIWDFPLRILIYCGERIGVCLVTSNPDFFAPQPILLCLRLRAGSLTFRPALAAFCGHGPLLHWLLLPSWLLFGSLGLSAPLCPFCGHGLLPQMLLLPSWFLFHGCHMRSWPQIHGFQPPSSSLPHP